MLLVEGIAGHPIVAQERAGADKALAENPKLKICATSTATGRPTSPRRWCCRRSPPIRQPIDAVWTTGSESRVVAEAFAEAGRPAPLITGSITGDALGYWKANPDKYRFEGHAVLPHWTAQTLFRVGVRMLEGQKPKLNTLMIPIPPVHRPTSPTGTKDCMTRTPSRCSRCRRRTRCRRDGSTPISQAGADQGCRLRQDARPLRRKVAPSRATLASRLRSRSRLASSKRACLKSRTCRRRYGETVALDGASIAFRPGTIHTILGENGRARARWSSCCPASSGRTAARSGSQGKPFSRVSPAAFQAPGLRQCSRRC